MRPRFSLVASVVLVSRQDEGEAIRWYELAGYPPTGVQHTPDWLAPLWLQITNNRFGIDQPMAQLRVGDFDGDGLQDLFVATGQSPTVALLRSCRMR